MLVPAPLSMAALMAAPPTQTRPAGTRLLCRGETAPQVLYLEWGRVLLGVIGRVDAQDTLLELQLGAQVTPGWLDATAAVLNLPAAMDAVAETEVTLRRVPLAAFNASLADGSVAMRAEIGRAHV